MISLPPFIINALLVIGAFASIAVVIDLISSGLRFLRARRNCPDRIEGKTE